MMRNNKLLIFLVFPLLMSFHVGCSRKIYPPESATPTACTISAEVDENGNFTSIKTENNELGTSLDLNIWLHRKEDKNNLQLVVIYRGLEWLFVKPAETLIMTADDQEMRLTSSGRIELQSALSRLWGMEMAAYDITPEQLKGITYAKEVKCKIKKREYSLSPSNFGCFRRFYEENVKDKAF
ncbi:MAG: hypothetical protein P8017_06790 [Deltaproteobacteria bacterium]|jgi:hypothetical protein